jgi:hypothetical protein
MKEDTVKLTTVFIVLTLCIAAPLSAQKQWKTFAGAWFEIDYPPDFIARPSLKSTTAKGWESAFFAAKDGSVEFYVFAPQWSGTAKDILPNDKTEIATVQEKHGAGGAVGRLVTITAKDRSYLRMYTENEQDGVKTITGIKCRDNAVYRKYKAVFEKFRLTLRQYND